MESLKSLNLVPLLKTSSNPTLDRRTRIIARLEEQKLLLKDPSYQHVVRSWPENEADEKIPRQIQTKYLVVDRTAQTAPIFFHSFEVEAD
jgi:hypothetical protein